MKTLVFISLLVVSQEVSTPGIPRIMCDDILNQCWPATFDAVDAGQPDRQQTASINNRSGLGDGTNPGQGGVHTSTDNGGTLNPGGLRRQ